MFTNLVMRTLTVGSIFHAIVKPSNLYCGGNVITTFCNLQPE